MNAVAFRAGFLTTVQDLGRTGAREHGVALAGALDSHAFRVANALAGNGDDAAGLELTLGNVALRFADERIIAWCGGEFDVKLERTPLPPGRSVRIAAGDEVTITAPGRAARAWLAISGGIDVPVVLGSRSTDLRARFGGLDGRSLRDGDALPLGHPSPLARQIAHALTGEFVSSWSAARHWVQHSAIEKELRVTRGADWSRFTSHAQETFPGAKFEVSPDSDRMGARLRGPVLECAESTDMVSEPVAPGTIQVPPDGSPILLLNDCQTIGGYPKIAHVISVDLSLAAALRPGDSVWFREVEIDTARALLSQRERDFALFRRGLEMCVA